MLNILKSNIIYQEYNEIYELQKVIVQIEEDFKCMDYQQIIEKCNRSYELCSSLREDAILRKDRFIADSSLVIRFYFNMMESYSKLWSEYKNKSFKQSWLYLQDCLDCLKVINRNTDKSKLEVLYQWQEHFEMLEKLYPYKVFASSEYIYKDSYCSICERGITSPECTHIPGEIYWGKMASNIIRDVEFKAVALVSHPKDKRCIIESTSNDEDDFEKFKALNYFLEHINHPLTIFYVEEKEYYSKNEQYKYLNRNDVCTCGSNKKFKKCCGKDDYIEHKHCHIQITGLLNNII